MAKKDFPKPTVLNQLLSYDEKTGKLYWKYRPASNFKTKRAYKTWNSRFSGKEAFTAKDSLHGYHVGNVNYKLCMAHRVIWAMVKGYWPRADIDHVNGVRSDNRIENLREASRSENNCNSGLRSDNTSGYRGVSYQKNYGKWVARIYANKKLYRLGYFDTPESAHEAYCIAAKKYHGEFARLS